MRPSNLTINDILANWPSKLDGQLSFTLGLSGGIDSVVLLDLFVKIKQMIPLKLDAIHVNHNLSSNAQNWSIFCHKLCQMYQIPLTIYSTKVIKIASQGLENSARTARYKEFYNHSSDVIILAHHQDDQIETMLSQIMRGSSLNNCAGMLPLSTKNNKLFWRPLLNYSKQLIEQYAQLNNLQHIEDESNRDNQYLRNFLRNQIIPQLKNFDVNIEKKLLQIVINLQNTVKLNAELAELDFQNIKISEKYLDKSRFKQLTLHRQINLLNYYIQQYTSQLVSQKALSEFCNQIKSLQAKQIRLKINNIYQLYADKTAISVLTTE